MMSHLGNRVPEGFAVLKDVCHAFGSARDNAEAEVATVRWLRTALGVDGAPVRLILAGDDGDLSLARSEGDWETVSEGAGVWQLCLEAKRTLKARVSEPVGYSVMTLPLISRGESIGVIEVMGPSAALEAQEEVLEAIGSQSAILFANLRTMGSMSRRIDALSSLPGRLRNLLRARDVSELIAGAGRLLFDAFGCPLVGWATTTHNASLKLVGAPGVSVEHVTLLEDTVGQIQRWGLLDKDERASLLELAELATQGPVAVVDLGESFLLMGKAESHDKVFLATITALLEDLLVHYAIMREAERRSHHMNLGIACTAHEIKSPIATTNLVIEHVLRTSSDSLGDIERDLLTRSGVELGETSSLIENLLSFSVGEGPVNPRMTDVVEIAWKAIRSSTHSMQQDRVAFRAPERFLVELDPIHIRQAVSNLIRNALAYSANDTVVNVRVRDMDDRVVIEVSDQGPGIPENEIESIFDPLARGQDAKRGSDGKGLGLYVAKRAIDAHGGDVWVHSSPNGTTFFVALPLRQPSPTANVASRNGVKWADDATDVLSEQRVQAGSAGV